MCFSLSRLLAPTAVLFVAVGLSFGIMAHDAFADQSLPGMVSTPASPRAQEAVSALAELKAGLDQNDRLAVLEAIHVGLSDAPDGATYLWRRQNGKIAGSVHPTTSFKDANGKVCRYLVFQLVLGDHTRQVEGIACRQDDKSWLLEG